jgi:carbonic anhydrase
MDRLIAGYRRFRETQWPERRATFEQLAERGQSPRALVVACSDSRVDPTMIFGAAPGELFVVRNVAALVPPYDPDDASHATSSALEFGIRVLQVPDLIVVGHELCGGIQALLNGVPEAADDFLAGWIRIAEPARRRVLERGSADLVGDCGEEAVRLSLENLRSFPWVDQRVRAGRLRLHGAIFDIRSGLLSLMGADGRFAAV